MGRQIRVGITRLVTSRAQAAWLEDCLQQAAAQGAISQARIELVEIQPTGPGEAEAFMDMEAIAATQVSDLRRALGRGEVDVVLHHLGDRPGAVDLGELAAVLGRGERGDVLLGQASLEELPPGARVAVASDREGVQLRERRPDIHAVHLRGDPRTCVAKLDAGAIDALLLPGAIASWIGETRRVREKLSLESFVPGPGQGILGLETRPGDLETRAWASRLDRPLTRLELAAELECSALLAGESVSGVHAKARGDALVVRAFVAGPMGEGLCRGEATIAPPCTLESATQLGRRLARDLEVRMRAESPG